MITSDRSIPQLDFLNSLELPIDFGQIEETETNTNPLRGWQGLSSFDCFDRAKRIYQVEIRYAWDENIFKQDLFDFGWSEAELLCKKPNPNQTGTKIIVYLCEPSTGLPADKVTKVPPHYLVGRQYTEIIHVYLLLPREHPFQIPQLTEHEKTRGYATTARFEKSAPSAIAKVANDAKDQAGGLRTRGLTKQGTAEKPLISIITVVYNGAKYLEQTIQSVINQNNPQIEYLIIDGGSNDGTLEIVHKYQDQIDYWVSEADGGIYDAMNKGTKLARGTHTLHINADDLLWRHDALDLKLTAQNLVTGVYVFQPEENFVKLRPPKTPSNNRAINIIRCPVYHPGFIGINNQNSYFDASYRIIADNIVIANKLQQEEYSYLAKTIAIHRGGGISAENALIGDREISRAILQTKNIPALLALGQKVLYSLLRDLAKKLGIVTLRRKYF